MTTYGRNLKALVENTKLLIEQEKLQQLNSKIMSIYHTKKVWGYYNGY